MYEQMSLHEYFLHQVYVVREKDLALNKHFYFC